LLSKSGWRFTGIRTVVNPHDASAKHVGRFRLANAECHTFEQPCIPEQPGTTDANAECRPGNPIGTCCG
jgi:hypothetical protein